MKELSRESQVEGKIGHVSSEFVLRLQQGLVIRKEFSNSIKGSETATHKTHSADDTQQYKRHTRTHTDAHERSSKAAPEGQCKHVSCLCVSAVCFITPPRFSSASASHLICLPHLFLTACLSSVTQSKDWFIFNRSEVRRQTRRLWLCLLSIPSLGWTSASGRSEDERFARTTQKTASEIFMLAARLWLPFEQRVL